MSEGQALHRLDDVAAELGVDVDGVEVTLLRGARGLGRAGAVITVDADMAADLVTGLAASYLE